MELVASNAINERVVIAVSQVGRDVEVRANGRLLLTILAEGSIKLAQAPRESDLCELEKLGFQVTKMVRRSVGYNRDRDVETWHVKTVWDRYMVVE